MLVEFLSLGSVEIANTARAYNYALGSPCCASLLKDPGCEGLHDMVGTWVPPVLDVDGVTILTPGYIAESSYSYANISDAPWYDPNLPESEDFIGSYPILISGITDSTQTASVTQGIEDGGTIGSSRDSTRDVRVRTMLVACTDAGLEFGLAWLKSALSTTFCGKHGDACGTSDLEFFMDCVRPLENTDLDYPAVVDPQRRFLHDVGTTSGPVIVDQFTVTSGAHVYVVEFILTAETPFVYGVMERISSAGTAVTAVSDVPFNLLTYPSAEVSDGTPQLISTNYAMNGSVEYGTTGWDTTPSGQVAGTQSTDISAIGPHSFRGEFTPNNSGSGQEIRVNYIVALPSVPKVSVSAWGAAVVQAGTAQVNDLVVEVTWLTSADAVISTELVGIIPDVSGGNAAQTGFTIPSGATKARVSVVADVDFSPSDEIRIYGDAVAVTVP